MLGDPIIAAIKKIGNITDMDSSYLKVCVDYCYYSLLGQASLSLLYLA